MPELTLLPTCPVCNTTWGIPISKFEPLVELQSAANAAVYMRGQAARLAVEAKDLRAQLAAANEAKEQAERELEIWKSVFPDLAPESVMPDRAKLEADNARLREALEKIASMPPGCSMIDLREPTGSKNAVSFAYQRIARAALADAPDAKQKGGEA